MSPTLPILEEAVAQEGGIVATEDRATNDVAAAIGHPHMSNRQLKPIRKAAKRDQKAAQDATFPTDPPEWLAKCKED